MASLLFSLIGVVLALNLTGGSLNLMSLIGVIMLMGLVAKNAILLLDCTRAEEEQGIDREDALMHAGRVRLRPILMTTFALMAGMMPVAIGVGEGGEFYSPMAVAIIGGTIVSTVLTLLVVPSFYDSIEIARERAGYKFRARAALGNAFVAFLTTLAEVLLTIVFARFFYRLARWLLRLDTPTEHPVERAARLVGFAVPAGFIARPKAWQRHGPAEVVAVTPVPAASPMVDAPKPVLLEPIKAS
jgi:predicted RND superfamily exporter protein